MLEFGVSEGGLGIQYKTVNHFSRVGLISFISLICTYSNYCSRIRTFSSILDTKTHYRKMHSILFLQIQNDLCANSKRSTLSITSVRRSASFLVHSFSYVLARRSKKERKGSKRQEQEAMTASRSQH